MALCLTPLTLCPAGMRTNGFMFDTTDAAGMDYALNRYNHTATVPLHRAVQACCSVITLQAGTTPGGGTITLRTSLLCMLLPSVKARPLLFCVLI